MTTGLSGAIPSLFGGGVLGHAVTGLVRIPGFMANCTSVMMVGELSIRGLTATLSTVGFQPAKNSWVGRIANDINASGIRPYNKVETRTLVSQAIAFAALGIVASELVRILGGSAPAVYNNVLTLLGPMRISPEPYLDNLRQLFGVA